MKQSRRPVTLVICILACLAAALFGVMFRPGAWYLALNKPPFNPPSWIFPPVWSVLYCMIAVAGWIAWRDSRDSRTVTIYFYQLIFNALWSWLFFGLHLPLVALLDIVALLCTIAAFISFTWSSHRAAAMLFIPYFFWVSFATLLNFELWRLNP